MSDATNKKSIDEDDEDSGVELGSFLPSDQDDNTSSSSGKPGFCLSMQYENFQNSADVDRAEFVEDEGQKEYK